MISADKDWLMAFEEIRSQAVLEWEVQKYGKEPIVRVGAATCGLAAGAEAVLAAFERELRQRSIKAVVNRVGCIGLCYAEPIVDIVMPGQPHISYRNVTPDIVPMLVEGHIVGGNPCLDFVLGIMRGNGEPVGVPALFDLPMLKPQVRVALRNCGTIDPENMQHYVANFGYSGMARALDMEPQRVIDEGVARLSAAIEEAAARTEASKAEFETIQSRVGELDQGEVGLDEHHDRTVAALRLADERVAELQTAERAAEREVASLQARGRRPRASPSRPFRIVPVREKVGPERRGRVRCLLPFQDVRLVLIT